MYTFARLTLLAAVIAAPLSTVAQDEAPKAAPAASHDSLVPAAGRQYINLSFTFSEIDEHGKVINTRRFEGITYAHSQGHEGGDYIRISDDVPVMDKEGKFAIHNVSLVSMIRYNNLYVINENHIALNIDAALSTLLPFTSEQFPITRQNSWTGNVLMPIGERKVIFSSDDLASKHVLQLDLLVTRVK
jgi:hypothetical protein